MSTGTETKDAEGGHGRGLPEADIPEEILVLDPENAIVDDTLLRDKGGCLRLGTEDLLHLVTSETVPLLVTDDIALLQGEMQGCLRLSWLASGNLSSTETRGLFLCLKCIQEPL